MRGDVSKDIRPSAFVLFFLASLAPACVGSDRSTAERPQERTEETVREAPDRAVSVIDYDTIPTVAYTVFEPETDSASPHRLTVRLLVLEPASRHALSKTVRQALDSLAAADSTLVAARAILYTGHPIGAGEVELTPAAYAFWVPPEGWAEARHTAAERLHRTYVYFGAPDWIAGDRENRDAAGSED